MQSNPLTPAALIIGAQKAGTTALIRNLGRHPDILGIEKELGFFSSRWEKGADWYYARLAESMPETEKDPADCVVIEKTPSYMVHPEAAERIKAFNPDMKIIVSLRNPVDRAFSRYNDILQDEPGKVTKSFPDLMRSGMKKQNHFIRSGKYALQLAPYFEAFGARNVHVVVQERWIDTPWETLKETMDFLGVRAIEPLEVKTIHRNTYDPMDPETRATLTAYFKPFNQELFDLLGHDIPEWS